MTPRNRGFERPKGERVKDKCHDSRGGGGGGGGGCDDANII